MHNHCLIKQFMILGKKEIYLIAGKLLAHLKIFIIKLYIIQIYVIVESHKKVFNK
jgi:hypothetical protein